MTLNSRLRQISRIATAIVVGAAAVAYNILSAQTANAAQLTSRKVTISTSQSGATSVNWAFQFSWGSATDVEGIIFQFCTTALGNCTQPTGMDVSNDQTSIAGGSQANFPNNGTAFTEVGSNTGDCSDTGIGSGVTMYCVNRTEATSATGTNATLTIAGVTNPTIPGVVGSSFSTAYVRISLYDNNGFSNSGGAGNLKVYDGVVAGGITQQLTITGRVQERLEFCVAAIGDGGAGDTTLPANCAAAPTTTSVDIGTIDNSTIVKAPVNTTATNGSNDSLGIAMVNTNASGGVVVTYFPEAATNVSGGDTDQLRRFRVLPTDCSATTTSVTDQCFIAASNAGETFSAGTERFGMNIPCIDTTQGTTSNLGSVPAAYSNTDATTTSSADCENTDAGVKFAWDESGTAATIASSSSVVDDEIIKLSFGATASATTPTGTYTAVTTFIATPTF